MNASAAEEGEIPIQSKPCSPQMRVVADEPYWRKLIPRRPTEILLLAVIALVISVQLKYLLDVRTEIPLQDDWTYLNSMFRSIDTHRVGAAVFDSTNGHFVVPAALAYLFSSSYLSLDLSPLRLLNFPLCLVVFLLVVHVITREIRSRFLRFYLYVGTCFIVFNLCFWEHLALGGGFSAILSVLFGGIALYYISKGTQPGANW